MSLARRALLAPLAAAAPSLRACGGALLLLRSIYIPSALPSGAAAAAGFSQLARRGSLVPALHRSGGGAAGSGAPSCAGSLAVRWESTRRKRIKAMTKHKYEKRQKKLRTLTALNQNTK